MIPRSDMLRPSHVGGFFLRYLCLCAFICGSFIAGCGRSNDEAADAPTLRIISPHGSDIRREFAQGFSRWHAAHFGSAVNVQWVDIASGGTNNVMRFLGESYSQNKRPDVDIVFGGGTESFVQLADKQYLEKVPPATSEELAAFSSSNLEAAVKIDPISAVPKDLFGSPLRGPNDVWIGATLSSFGMVVNKDRINELQHAGQPIAIPRTWEDLAGPGFIDRLSLSDPTKSGSVKTAYDMIFQQYGWEKGWRIVTLMIANAAVIRDGGSNPAEDVGSADAVAGVVIDFFGRLQVRRAGAGIVAFVIPEGGSTIDPDPIAMLQGSTRAQLAGEFIRFVVSPEGQRLWTFKAGTPGGPVKTPLGRMSILPSLYENESSNMTDPANPFAGQPPLKMDNAARTARGKFFADLVKAALIDNQEQLRRTREAIRAKGDPPESLDKLTALPTFFISKMEGDNLLPGDAMAITQDRLKQMADEFAPADKAKATFADRIQTRLKEHWRQEMANRLAALH